MILVFALAQLLDVSSAMLMPVQYESNPLMRMLLGQPLAAIAVKVSLIVVCVSIVAISRRKNYRLASWVYPFGAVAGMIGLASNLAVLRALAEGA